MSEIYRLFANPDLDFSEEAATEMYLFETRGEGNLQFNVFLDRKLNGFASGKRWMNVCIEMWKEDIRLGRLWLSELEQDYPKWFVDKFLKNVSQSWPLTIHQTLELYRD